MKGVMYELLIGLFGLVFIGLLFAGLNAAWDGGINSYGRTHLRYNASSTVDSKLANDLDIVSASVTYFPFVAVMLFLVYLFVVGQRRSF